jgi:HAD superfamily phosphatase
MTAQPTLIIFDVDGVLVDVSGSFHQTVLETVKHFTGKRVTLADLHRWKNRGGYNDDWKLSTAWVQSLGGKFEFEEVKHKFVEIYWGVNGKRGTVAKEKWLLPRASLRRLSKQAELAIFTGRVWDELDYTLDRCKTREFFPQIVTAEDVKQPKPSPEGLLAILKGRDPETAIYLGDNVDDALASQSARAPFIGVLPRGSHERRHRGPILRKLGAKAILGEVTELEDWLKKSGPRRS